MPTLNCRGTGGYRAPELLVITPAFTKKVDIWALGCILYELLMSQKAFTDDWTVWDHYLSNSKHPQVTAQDLDGCFKKLPEHENSLLSQLFARDPAHRPHVSKLRLLFQSYAILSSDSLWKEISKAILFPSFSEWTAITTQWTSKNRLLLFLSGWYEGSDIRTSSRLTYLLVAEAPDDEYLRNRLEDLFESTDRYTVIDSWCKLVLQHPYKTYFHDALTRACVRLGGSTEAVVVWKNIFYRDPTKLRFMLEYVEMYAEICVERNEEVRAIEILTPLVEKYPRVTRLRDRLKTALEGLGEQELERETWRHLVRKHPEERELVAELKRVCEEMVELEKVVSVWEGLVDEHPEVPELQGELRHALRWNGDCDKAVDIWEALKKKYPENKGVEREWLNACREREETGNEIKGWMTLVGISI